MITSNWFDQFWWWNPLQMTIQKSSVENCNWYIFIQMTNWIEMDFNEKKRRGTDPMRTTMTMFEIP